MSDTYFEIMQIVAERDSARENVEFMRELEEEMEQNDREYRAVLRAAEMFVDNPATDSTALGRIRRISNIFSQDELNEKIGLLIDVVFSHGGVSA